MTFWSWLINIVIKSAAYLFVGCSFSIILLAYALFQEKGRYEYVMKATPYPIYIGAVAALAFVVVGLVIYLLKNMRMTR
ncbi:amino acid permease [Inquilinus ginsengisoli]|uniref:Amino acid permease n=1 Tax=Inquilinus ginsengisoli TaxID=363840 RepID=A0ABU1JTS6_9PROT|nr:hypothetical protein [Inquilinus ginsengisoli]MDR6291687.1 amino acid permease [Inquilinus ginsengisoli]